MNRHDASNPSTPSRRVATPGLLLAAVLIVGIQASPGLAKNEGDTPTPPKAPTLDAYGKLVLGDKPVAYWRFDDSKSVKSKIKFARNDTGDNQLTGKVVRAGLGQAGPRPPRHTNFSPKNGAVGFGGSGERIEIADPGDQTVFDFRNGDTITIEAWVNPASIGNDAQIYVIGKGRTNNRGVARDNQNWALRLRGERGKAVLSFLFRSEDKLWHRWNSDLGFKPNTGWHHVVVSYTFGKPKSVIGYIDGKPSAGKWDYAGETDASPVVDNDEIWIGSSMGGSTGSTFRGLIDEVAIYRKTLDPARIAQRVAINTKVPAKALPAIKTVAKPKKPEKVVVWPPIAASTLPSGKVRVELIEGVPNTRTWNFQPKPASLIWEQDLFAFSTEPRKYNSKGLIVDWSNPFMLRAATVVSLPKGEHTFLLRAWNGARLKVDGKVIASTPFARAGGNAHQSVPKLPKTAEGMRIARVAHVDKVVTYQSDGKAHVFTLEATVGGKGIKAETGELLVASLTEDTGAKTPDRVGFYLLSANSRQLPLTDDAWEDYALERADWHEADNQRRRLAMQRDEAAYWAKRHDIARKHVESLKPIDIPATTKLPTFNTVDKFINAKLVDDKTKPAPLTSDYAFAKRISLDTIGEVPSPELVQWFMSLKGDTPSRRAMLIDKLLSDKRWADNWVGYWQDVLAENPGILKPELNNTGPFRFWIHESFLDNKPFDRFVTELVMMEGSKYGGGPAGFEMASQNDVPMAAKAHVVGQAVMGMNMACARCHDAPFHDFEQQQLFSLAAMLGRKPQGVPKTSTIPLSEKEIRRLSVTVSMKPGMKAPPSWPFDADTVPLKEKDLPETLTRNAKDSRARLAAMLTAPQNDRFSHVIINRMWARYLGHGFVNPVDDWEGVKPSHPQLLSWLTRQFVMSGYDLKHVARLIFNSHAYQRQVDPTIEKPSDQGKFLFATPARRRMLAEQVVDSLFAVAGKRMNTEELNFDVDNKRTERVFLNLGHPTRAWEFTSLANERDRPALALPKAQSINDVLLSFGWRNSRQNPLTQRERTPTVRQPAILANGIVSRRITTLSDDSAFTALALKDQPLKGLINDVVMRMMARPANAKELADFTALLKDGYAERVLDVAPATGPKKARPVHAVGWSNHLSPEANLIKKEMERLARAGDPPTKRLNSDWRQRAEDMLWALLNSPEFVWVP